MCVNRCRYIGGEVIFTVSVKGIKFYPVNRGMYGTEQLKVCCDFCRMKNSRATCW